MMYAADRVYVRALRRLLELEARRAGVLELGPAVSEVREAERAVLESGGDRDYLHHLAKVAEGVAAYFALWPKAAA